MSDNILTNLFANDFLYYFVRDVFVSLDPISLHACRQVNTQWNLFIQEEVWGKPEGRMEMEKKLLNRIRMGTPKVHKLSLGASIFCCQMNGSSLGVGCTDGNLIIFSLKKNEEEDNFKQLLRCSNASVNFDMTDKLVVTGSNQGKVAVWKRDSSSVKKIFESTPPASQSQGFIAGVKIIGDTIITATTDRVISVHTHNGMNVWRESVKGFAIGQINHIDGDEGHILFATSNGLNMATMVDSEKGKEINLTEINVDAGKFIHHCAFFYPHAAHTPNEGGFKISNVITGKLLRHLHNGVTIGVVAMNKKILIVQDASQNWDIFIYSRNQLIDSNIQDKDLWSRRIQVGDTSSRNFYDNYSYFLAVNETSIVHFSKTESKIVIQDYWLGDLAHNTSCHPRNSDKEKK